jgi:DNA-binding transcriptional regulator YiaG
MSSNLVTGRQLRAARVLAGLTQQGLAGELGVNERVVRFWDENITGRQHPAQTSGALRRRFTGVV